MFADRFSNARAKVRALAAALLCIAVAACSTPNLVPGGRVSSAAPPKVRQSYSTPRTATADLRQCEAKLNAANVAFNLLPDQNYGGGCSAINAVKLLNFGVEATNLGAMTCPLAANFAYWTHYAVQPAARLVFGSELVRIETYGTYNCRNIAGSGKLSEHAHSNAVDVSGFVLADGRRISVLNGWNGDGQSQRFLRIIRGSACKRFKTVLSPDYNADHANHLHLDMGGRGDYCR